MIAFLDIDKSIPYKNFQELYKTALENNQKNIEAMCISSYSKETELVDSRFVNLKYIKGSSWTFFSNYNGPKSKQFSSHDQISIIFYWNSINVQIKMRAKIKKTSSIDSDEHFSKRSIEKNAIAISSKQSEIIESYDEVLENYKKVLEDDNHIKKRPDYWGGYTFTPFYIEFWKGHESRINKRELYVFENGAWSSFFLQP
tara:strand:+ start:20920 stop:21519 length:600 start_codon:yes stop_codon:yes gene_type:complete